MRMWLATMSLMMTTTAMADEPAQPLPSATSMVQTGQCETPPVNGGASNAVGADQTYTGNLTATPSGRVTGIEQRHIAPNSTWRTTTAVDGTTGRDCVVTWVVTGQIGPVGSCRDCELSIAFEANIDPDQSTCNQRLMADGAHFRGSYDLKKNPDGTLGVFFSTSGNPLGTGRWVNNELVWASTHKCIWM
ncbi:MAG: hypothetical protein ACJAZO_002435 [Myxococcota bacterium]|jgi:hypothetical protein